MFIFIADGAHGNAKLSVLFISITIAITWYWSLYNCFITLYVFLLGEVILYGIRYLPSSFVSNNLLRVSLSLKS